MNTTRTQAAAKHCADLANAVARGYTAYHPEHFTDFNLDVPEAFRREVEAKDAMIRELMHSAKQAQVPGNDWRRELALMENILRANLLVPDPKPTLLEEFLNANDCRFPEFKQGAKAFADWIAKRQQENEG